MKTTQGRRIYPDADGHIPGMEPGDYLPWKGQWLLCLPTGIRGTVNDKIWKITEHEDGTITASPSILTTSKESPELNWHGYLEKGVWREC